MSGEAHAGWLESRRFLIYEFLKNFYGEKSLRSRKKSDTIDW